MNTTLSELIRPYEAVSLIGMCKNAGKTTVLNRLIQELNLCGTVLGLTSIGRDGEDKDLVTGTKKPGIQVAMGTILATASDLVVSHCDITREILDATEYFTPMGQVVLVRARSDGSVQLAGPSTTGQLAALRQLLVDFGAEKVLIDGALSRKTLCSRQVSDATILCTGASYHKSLETLVEDTAYHCRILTLPESPNPVYQQVAATLTDPRSVVLFGADGHSLLPSGMTLEGAMRGRRQLEAVFFGGALTDFALKPLLMSSAPLEGLVFLVRDSSKILLKPDTYEKLLRRGVQLQVLDSVNLVAVTINPFSAYWNPCSKEELKSRLAERVRLPVINVMEDQI